MFHILIVLDDLHDLILISLVFFIVKGHQLCIISLIKVIRAIKVISYS